MGLCRDARSPGCGLTTPLTIGRQRLEHLLPDAGIAPAAEALMRRLAFRQIAPMHAGA